MIKLLLIACAFASSIFMVTQLVSLYYFNNNYTVFKAQNEEFKQNDDKLFKNIKLLHSICKHLRLNLTLIDEGILGEFLSSEIIHRTNNNHDHTSCRLFCGKRLVTFLVQGLHDDDPEDFTVTLQQKGFLTITDEDYDKQQENLEHRHGITKLIYHLYLEKDDTLIHIVLPHRIDDGYLWTHKCNPQKVQNEGFHLLISNKKFCHSDHLLKHVERTKALIDGVYIFIPQYIRTFLDNIESRTFKFCDYHQARKFYSVYGYDSSFESEMFRTKARNLLETVTKVLSQLEVPFWLSSGTCLGWFRQCDFIPHSKDVDIGIWISDYNNKIIESFEKHGLKLTHLFGKLEDSFELSFKLDDMKLDIFFFYKEKDYMWNGGTQARTGKKFKYRFDNFSICWTIFKKLHVRVPCDTKRYILANYGVNWGTLVKEWDWKRSPPNVMENGEWDPIERSMVIKMYQ